MLEMTYEQRQEFREIVEQVSDREIGRMAVCLRNAIIDKRPSAKLSQTDCLEVLARIGIILCEKEKPCIQD